MTLAIQDLREVRRLLYPARRKWYSIGIELGLDIEDLKTIKAKCSDPGECLTEIIELWLKSIDPLPSWKVLGEALKEDPVDEAQLAKQAFTKHASSSREKSASNVQETPTQQVMREETPQSPNDCTEKDPSHEGCKIFPFLSLKNMTAYETKRLTARLKAESTQIKHKFGTLVAKTAKSLENSDTTAANLKMLFDTCAEELADMIELADTIPDVMSKATRGKYWTFFNYTLLESVINAYCESLTENLKSYVIDFQDYCKRRLYEVPRDVLQAENSPNESQSILCVKLDDNFSIAKPISDFLEIQHNLSEILHVEHLHLVHVKEGCIELTFRYFTKQNVIPSIIADENKQVRLQNLGVLWLSSGEQVLQLKAEFEGGKKQHLLSQEEGKEELSRSTTKSTEVRSCEDKLLDRETEAICASFERLVSQTESCIQDCHATIDTFISFFRHHEIDELANSIESTDTIAAIFDKVKKRGYWNFFNYELLKKLIVTYCSDTPIISHLKAYMSELKTFCQYSVSKAQTTVLQDEFDHNSLSTFTVKMAFPTDAPTLASIKRVQQQIARIMNKNVLLKYIKSSELGFRIFNSSGVIFPKSEDQRVRLAEIGVQWFRCSKFKLQLKPEQEVQFQLRNFSNYHDYQQALAQGQVDVTYAQAMMVGLEGVGKSSLLNGFMKLQSLKKGENRCFLARKNPGASWEEIETHHSILDIAQLMLMVSDTSQENPHTNEVIEEARNVMLQVQSGMTTMPVYNDETYLRVWDVKGTQFFHDFLPAFITPRTLSLLVFDARCDLSNPDSKELSHMIQWIATVYGTHSKQCPPNPLPSVLPIGSHGDDEKVKEIGNMLNPLTQAIAELKFDHLVQEGIIADCTEAKENPAFQRIISAINKFTANTVIPTPITWVLFRKVLEKYARERPVVPLAEVKELCKACSVPESSLLSVLAFYHELAVFFYYCWMPNYVIADPQWIIWQMGLTEHMDRMDVIQSMTRNIIDPTIASLKTPAIMLKNFLLFSIADELGHHINSFPISYQMMPRSFTPSEHVAPLYLTFSTKHVPCGFFQRLTVAISQQSNLITIKDPDINKNKFTFIHVQGNFVFLITANKLNICIQVEHNSRISYHQQPLLSTCQGVFMILVNSLKEVKKWLPDIDTNFCAALNDHFTPLNASSSQNNALSQEQKVWVYAHQNYKIEIFPYRTLYLLLLELKKSGQLATLVEYLEVSYIKRYYPEQSNTFAGTSLMIDTWQREMKKKDVSAVPQIMHYLERIGFQNLPLIQKYAKPLPWSCEQRVTPQGCIYYVDHKTCSTTWDRPQFATGTLANVKQCSGFEQKMSHQKDLKVINKPPEYSLFYKKENTPLLHIPEFDYMWTYSTRDIITLIIPKKQTSWRNMIITLSENLTLRDCKKIEFLKFLSSIKIASNGFQDPREPIQEDPDISLYILSWLEAGMFITPWNVNTLESVLEDIDRPDLLPIVADFTSSEEYKDACEETLYDPENVKVNQGTPDFFYTHEYDKKFKKMILKLSERLTHDECEIIATSKDLKIPDSAGDLDAAFYVLGLWDKHNMGRIGDKSMWTRDYLEFKNEVSKIELILQNISRTDLLPVVSEYKQKEIVDDLNEVYGLLYDVRSKWYEIGKELGLPEKTLKHLHKDNQDNKEVCLRKMLSTWLKITDPPPTWKTLIVATNKASFDSTGYHESEFHGGQRITGMHKRKKYARSLPPLNEAPQVDEEDGLSMEITGVEQSFDKYEFDRGSSRSYSDIC